MPLLLAVDSSGKNSSLALARITAGNEIDVLEVVPLAGGTFSSQLVPQIIDLLQKHGHTKTDLEAFAVASGPGSFTGLRVGLAAIKALAEALQKPIAAVSLLEAVARCTRSSGRIFVVMDAGRGDVYAGDYEVDSVSSIARMNSERLLSREDFIAEVKSTDFRGKAIVVTDAALVEIFRGAQIASAISVVLVEAPDSGVTARLGWEHLKLGQTVLPEDLEANYLRHSDAEIFSKPKA
jgi:tRNA threonylcarbamoyladenosine biosynthesis protein TsaB